MSPVYPFDEAATARVVVGDDGTLVDWGPGARALLGWEPQDVVGSPAVRLLADGTPPAPIGSRWSGTLTLRHREGHPVAVWLLAHRRRPDDGGTGHWLVVAPLPEPPSALDTFLAVEGPLQSPCAIAVYDERLRLSHVNDAMAELLGLPAEHLRGLRPSRSVGSRRARRWSRTCCGSSPPAAPRTCRPARTPAARTARTPGRPG